MVYVADSSLQADSHMAQKSAAWSEVRSHLALFYIHQMNWMDKLSPLL